MQEQRTVGSIEDLLIARLHRRHKPVAAAPDLPNLAGIEQKNEKRGEGNLRLHCRSKDEVAPKPRDEPSKTGDGISREHETLISEGLSCAEIAATVGFLESREAAREIKVAASKRQNADQAPRTAGSHR
jgi:hypothetical protein